MSCAQPQAPEPLTCNGHEELCGRRLDEVAFAGTHNSYSNTDEGFAAPGQTHSVTRQLHDGIRVLHFEVLSWDDVTNDAGAEIALCHGLCELGHRELASQLRDVGAFLQTNPGEVVVFLLERADRTVTADDLGNAFIDAGLSTRVRVQTLGAPWATLGELLEGGTPVVALCGKLSATPDEIAVIGLKAAWSINRDQRPLAEMLAGTAANLERAASELAI